MPTVRLHLDLLGTFRLRQSEQPVAGFDHARLQHLLAYLVLHRAAPISRQQLAFLFWPFPQISRPSKTYTHCSLDSARHCRMRIILSTVRGKAGHASDGSPLQGRTKHKGFSAFPKRALSTDRTLKLV